MRSRKNYTQQLEELLVEFVNSPLVLDDDWLKYVEIQVPRTLVDEARAALEQAKADGN